MGLEGIRLEGMGLDSFINVCNICKKSVIHSYVQKKKKEMASDMIYPFSCVAHCFLQSFIGKIYHETAEIDNTLLLPSGKFRNAARDK